IRMGALRDGHYSDACDPGGWDYPSPRTRRAVVSRRDFRSEFWRGPGPLRTLLLVLLASGRVHYGAPRFRGHGRSYPRIFEKASLWLQDGVLFLDRHCLRWVSRLGAPHV